MTVREPRNANRLLICKLRVSAGGGGDEVRAGSAGEGETGRGAAGGGAAGRGAAVGDEWSPSSAPCSSKRLYRSFRSRFIGRLLPESCGPVPAGRNLTNSVTLSNCNVMRRLRSPHPPSRRVISRHHAETGRHRVWQRLRATGSSPTSGSPPHRESVRATWGVASAPGPLGAAFRPQVPAIARLRVRRECVVLAQIRSAGTIAKQSVRSARGLSARHVERR